MFLVALATCSRDYLYWAETNTEHSDHHRKCSGSSVCKAVKNIHQEAVEPLLLQLPFASLCDLEMPKLRRKS